LFGKARASRHIPCRGAPEVEARGGRLLSVTGVAMDITTRKEAEAVRHRLAKGERLRALGEMASGIAKPYRITDLRQVADHVAGALAKR